MKRLTSTIKANSRVYKKIQERNIDKKTIRKNLAILAVMIVVGFVAITLGIKGVDEIHPRAFCVDGAEVCYLSNKSDANEAVDLLVAANMPADNLLKAIDTNGRLTVEKSKSVTQGRQEAITPKEAAELIVNKYQKADDNPIDITLLSSTSKIVPYTPAPNVLYDKTMIAGDVRVAKEGKDGTQEVSTLYVYVNGELKKTEKGASKIIDQGKKATVYRGKLGLPEGADWRTFDGDPIFKDGAELITTAQKYIGSPYKYGGYSFKTGIDCVQFVRAIYKMYGINLPNSHSGLRKVGKGVSLKNAQKGDIVCYNGHVGIYMGDGKLIHSTSKGGVKVRDNVNMKGRHIITIRRVVQ